MPEAFKLNECIYTIYNEIIEKSLTDKYQYAEVLEEEIKLYKNADYCSNIMCLCRLFLNTIKYIPEDIELLINQLKDLHTLVLLEKGKSLIVLMKYGLSNIIVSKTIKLYSFTTMQKLLPPLTGLIIGVVSSVGRSLAIAAVAEATTAAAAAASTLWIPVIGWGIFGLTTLASIGWVAYSHYKKENSAKLSLPYTATNGQKIVDVLVFEDLSNGWTKNKKFAFNEQKLSYEIELVNKTTSQDSAFLSVKCIVILSDKATSVVELAEKIKKDCEAKYD
jgi:hypothetical protein